MPIVVQCSGCGGKFRTPDEAAGRTVRCPKCSAAIDVRSADQQQSSRQLASTDNPLHSPPTLPARTRPIPEKTRARLHGMVWAWVGGTVATLVIVVGVLWASRSMQRASETSKAEAPPQVSAGEQEYVKGKVNRRKLQSEAKPKGADSTPDTSSPRAIATLANEDQSEKTAQGTGAVDGAKRLLTVRAHIIRGEKASQNVEGWLFHVVLDIDNRTGGPMGIGHSAALYLLDINGHELGSTGVRLKVNKGGIAPTNHFLPDDVLDVSPKGNAAMSWAGMRNGNLVMGADLIEVTKPFDEDIGWPPIPVNGSAHIELKLPVKVREGDAARLLLIPPILKDPSSTDRRQYYFYEEVAERQWNKYQFGEATSIAMSSEFLLACMDSVRSPLPLKGCCLNWRQQLDPSAVACKAAELGASTRDFTFRLGCLKTLAGCDPTAASELAGVMIAECKREDFQRLFETIKGAKNIPLPRQFLDFVQNESDWQQENFVRWAISLIAERCNAESLPILEHVKVESLSKIPLTVEVLGGESARTAMEANTLKTIKEEIASAKAAILKRSGKITPTSNRGE